MSRKKKITSSFQKKEQKQNRSLSPHTLGNQKKKKKKKANVAQKKKKETKCPKKAKDKKINK